MSAPRGQGAVEVREEQMPAVCGVNHGFLPVSLPACSQGAALQGGEAEAEAGQSDDAPGASLHPTAANPPRLGISGSLTSPSQAPTLLPLGLASVSWRTPAASLGILEPQKAQWTPVLCVHWRWDWPGPVLSAAPEAVTMEMQTDVLLSS